MKLVALLFLFFCSWGFSKDYQLDYTQYKSCKYKAKLEKYCDGEESVWKSGSIRVNVTEDSLLFVFLNKTTTYRIELNTIKTDYNGDGDEILIFTGRSGPHNYMFVMGPDYFNLVRSRSWGLYFSNSGTLRKSLASSNFISRKFLARSRTICLYNEKMDRYDSNCVDYKYNEPKSFLLRTAYQHKNLYLFVDTLFALNVFDVEETKINDSTKILMYFGKNEKKQNISVMIGPDYFNVIFEKALKLSLMTSRTRGNSSVSGSSVAIAPDILITNAHVTKNMSNMELYLDEETVRNDGYEIVGEFSDDILDLAIIRVKGAKLNSCALSTQEPVLGSDILVFGYPQIQYQGADLKVTKGIVSGKNGYRGDKSTFQIDAAVQHGNSGGPIVSGGKIIGLTSSILNVEGSQNVNFGIKASKIYYLLKFYNIAPKATTQDFGKCTYLLVGN